MRARGRARATADVPRLRILDVAARLVAGRLESVLPDVVDAPRRRQVAQA